MQKLFLSDIDGTLLCGKAGIHPDVIWALRRFIDNGGRFGLCTGRGLSAVIPLFESLPVNAPCIVCGGSMLYDPVDRKILAESPLDESVTTLIKRIMDEYPDVSITACLRDSIVNLQLNDRLLTKGIPEDRGAPLVSLDKAADPLKLLFSCDEPQRLVELGEELIDRGVFSYHASGSHFYELMPRGADKGAAVRRAASIVGGADGCRLFTAGDASSDLTMKAASEVFFAPSSALLPVREKADVVIPPPEEGGIAKAIEYILAL